MKYRKKSTVVEAIQWFKSGDHPKVSDFGRLAVDCGSTCKNCGRVMSDHGWIYNDGCGIVVCPGDWIVPNDDGWYSPISPDEFAELYELVGG